jgi:hypothetical protein
VRLADNLAASGLGDEGKPGPHSARTASTSSQDWKRAASVNSAHADLGGPHRAWLCERVGQPRHVKIPRTTKLYDCTGDEITLDEVEWITI